MPLISSLGVMNAINFGVSSLLVKPIKALLIANSTATSPSIVAYNWDESSGFGSVISHSITTNYYKIVKFSSDTSYVALSTGAGLDVYPWSTSFGFGTKFAAGSIGVPSITSIDFGTNEIGYTNGGSSSYFNVVKWSSAGFGSIVGNPSSPAASNPRSIVFSRGRTFIVIVSDAVPRIYGFPYSSSTGFGTRASHGGLSLTQSISSDSSSLRPSTTQRLAIGLSSTPFMAYTGLLDTGFDAAGGTPATSIAMSVEGTVQTSADLFFVGSSTTVAAYKWSGLTRYTNSSSSLENSAKAIDVNGTSNCLGIALAGSPNIAAYKWVNNTGFGTKFTAPSSLPNDGNSNSISFSY
jgi:hypothetical protein